ncbi:hypothetical protein HPP92_014917 [Vanilla planifolia]|uniref:Uncharacterized protein n=1 Tax=Vanilla planifolia TaxID=51239 RepID=A0A835QGW4_VANPL|nr:hypothetical protein HPP92_014917 [Vanilla planifolia]
MHSTTGLLACMAGSLRSATPEQRVESASGFSDIRQTTRTCVTRNLRRIALKVIDHHTPSQDCLKGGFSSVAATSDQSKCSVRAEKNQRNEIPEGSLGFYGTVRFCSLCITITRILSTHKFVDSPGSVTIFLLNNGILTFSCFLLNIEDKEFGG